MICSSKEGFGQQKRIDELNTAGTLAFIPDSLKTPEQKELELKLLKVYHTNIKFRGDSIAFLLDKDGFLSEGLPEAAYLEYMEILKQFNNAVRNAKHPEIQQRLLSTKATDNAVHLKFFGYEYSGDIPLLEYESIQYTGPGGTPSIVNIKNAIHLIPTFPPGYFVFPPGAPVDSVKFVPK
jgi:hypothetical protein